MAKVFDKPITIQKLNSKAKRWEDLYKVHASINKAKSDNEYLSAGAIQSKRNLAFEVRYFADLEDISLNLQLYRILYRSVPYDIKDYDDFMLQHKTVKLLAVSY
jgi:SPP1 family predicted phage head-tail adaptor